MSSGQIEAVKWAALAAMLLGHVNRYVLDFSQEWMFLIGRQAFPLFAIALGCALARVPEDLGAAHRAAFGLLPFAVAAQFGVYGVGGGPFLNVLFLYLAACAWVAAADLPTAQVWAVRVLAAFVGSVTEFGLPGFAFVIALWAFLRSRSEWAAAGAVLAFVVVSWIEGSYAGFLAAPIVALIVARDIRLPRWPNAFAWIYVCQFPALWALGVAYG